MITKRSQWAPAWETSFCERRSRSFFRLFIAISAAGGNTGCFLSGYTVFEQRAFPAARRRFKRGTPFCRRALLPAKARGFPVHIFCRLCYNDWQSQSLWFPPCRGQIQLEVMLVRPHPSRFCKANCGFAGAAKGWMRNVRILTFRARRRKPNRCFIAS